MKFTIPIICVGNLSVGGTGKTPTINYLVNNLLLENKKIAVVSRGYGRRTKGFRLVDNQSTSATVGDEPLLFFKRWAGRIVVSVGENRATAIRLLTERYPNLDVILMDDGFQHRAVTPSSSILLSSYYNLFYRDFIMPSGSLREGRGWAKRADIIVVTKSPKNLSSEEKIQIRKKIATYVRYDTPVFFNHIQYGKPIAFGNEMVWKNRVFLVTGIANPQPLLQYLKDAGMDVIAHWSKADHFVYNDHEIEMIVDEYKKSGDCVILTTEKDYVKMGDAVFRRHLNNAPFFYIPVEFSFSKEKENFETAIIEMVNKNRGELD